MEDLFEKMVLEQQPQQHMVLIPDDRGDAINVDKLSVEEKSSSYKKEKGFLGIQPRFWTRIKSWFPLRLQYKWFIVVYQKNAYETQRIELY